MTCQEAVPFISALYDGEQVPPDVPAHVQTCPPCRARLKDYATIDAECRLLVAVDQTPEALPAWLPRAPKSRRSGFFGIFTAQVLVPRAALLVGVVAILVLGIMALWRPVQAPPQRPLPQLAVSTSEARKPRLSAGAATRESVATKIPSMAPANRVVYRPARVVEASAENLCVALYRPDWGLFIFSSHPFPGSSEGSVDNGRILLELDGKWYYVSPASGIGTGRRGLIYYKLIRGYEPARASDPTDTTALEGATRQFLPGCSAESYQF